MASTTWREQNWLISFNEAKLRHLEIGTDNASKDEQLPFWIAEASADVESHCRRKFMPFVDTRYFDHPDNPYKLKLDEDLLAITTITTQNTVKSLSVSEYRLLPVNLEPKHAVEILSDQGAVFSVSTTPQSANAITGIWGYHQRNFDSGADINQGAEWGASATALTVTDGGRFEIGQHLKIEEEQLFVEAIVTNDLTVARGVNGTTAAAHADGTDIHIYRAPDDIIKATGILVARASKRSAAAGGDLAGSRETGIRVTRRLPADVQSILDNGYVRSTFAWI